VVLKRQMGGTPQSAHLATGFFFKKEQKETGSGKAN
jgi:hypothetical protein